MNKWDQRFCELAKYISKWSKDPNAKVGAVLFSKKEETFLSDTMGSQWEWKIQPND